MELGVKVRNPHPLQDERVLRQALNDISTSAAPTALSELIRWLASLHEPRGMDVRVLAGLVIALDEAAQGQVRQAAGLYLSNAFGSRSVRYKALGRDFHAVLGQAYDLLLAALASDFTVGRDDRLRTEILLRTVRTATGEMKWAAFDYQSISPRVWQRAVGAYRAALACGSAETPIILREGRETRSTVSREFIRLVAMHCVNFDQLSPERIEAADKLVRYLQHTLILTAEPHEGSRFSIDLEGSDGPRRLLQLPERAAPLRFFRPSDALPVLQELAESVNDSDLGPAFAGTGAPTVAATIRHLKRHWGNQPPQRQYRRHAVKGAVALATGLGLVRSLISGEALLRPAPAWTMIDASRNGFGIRSRTLDQEICRVGTLVGAHLGESDKWVLAQVRRVRFCEREGASVGLVTISNGPRPAMLDDGKRRWHGILCDPLLVGRHVRIVCEPGFVRSGERIFVKQGARMIKIEPGAVLSSGPGYQIFSCVVP
jgi:hypothetical protein